MGAKIRQDAVLRKGELARLAFTVVDFSGSAVTLTGFQASWVMRRSRTTSDVLSKTHAAGIGLLGSVATVQIDPSDTADLMAGSYFHELRLTDAAGDSRVVAVGTLALEEAATSAPA